MRTTLRHASSASSAGGVSLDSCEGSRSSLLRRSIRLETHVVVRVQAATDSLLARKRPRLRSFEPRGPCALDVQALDDTSEELDDGTQEPGISGQQATQGKRIRQHPLPHRAVRQHLSDDVQRRGGHAPSAARRVDSAPFARVCDQHVLATACASKPRQAESRDATAQEPSELQLHVAWQRLLVGLRRPRSRRIRRCRPSRRDLRCRPTQPSSPRRLRGRRCLPCPKRRSRCLPARPCPPTPVRLPRNQTRLNNPAPS
jgi:hypothetical protein